MVDECHQLISQIKQMERSMAGGNNDYDYNDNNDSNITTPLLKCLQGLKEKHKLVKRRHAERYDSVKSMYSGRSPSRSTLCLRNVCRIGTCARYIRFTTRTVRCPDPSPSHHERSSFDRIFRLVRSILRPARAGVQPNIRRIHASSIHSGSTGKGDNQPLC